MNEVSDGTEIKILDPISGQTAEGFGKSWLSEE
jgi:hypothetical protein